MIFIASVSIVFFVIALKNIRWAIFTVTALLPTYLIRFSVFGFPSTLLEVMLVITIAVWGLKHHGFFTFNARISKWSLPVMLFLITGLIGVIVAPDVRPAFGLFRAYILEPILFFLMLVSVLRDERDVRRIFIALGFSALAISIYAIVQRATGWHIPAPWDAERRVTSFYPFPNAIGLFLAPLIPFFITFTLAAPQNRVTRNWPIGQFLVTGFFGITAFLSCMAIVFAKTEGALVGLVGSLAIMGVAIKKTRLFTIAALCVISYFIFFTNAGQPIAQKVLLRDWSGQVRTTQWKETAHMLADRPFFGAGLASYPTVFAPHHKATYLEIFQYPHNIILNFWTELGLLGLLAFGWIIVRFFKRSAFSFQLSKIHIGLATGMLTLLIHGLVDVPYFKNDLAIEFWIIIAAVAILKDCHQSQPIKYEKS